MVRRRFVIPAPAPQPKDLDETIRSMEKAAQLLKTLKEEGVSSELRSQIAVSEIGEPRLPPKILNASEHAIVQEIRGVTGETEYKACLVLESVLTVMTDALESGQRVKLNKLGTFYVQLKPRLRTVAFTPSPSLVLELNK